MIEFVHDLQKRQRALIAPTPAPLWPTLLAALLLAAVVYVPAAFAASFLGFDDNFYFGPDNPEFREGLSAVLDPTRTIANAYLPVAHASLWLDFWLSPQNAFWPHVHSLVVHALAAFVLVRVLLQLGASSFVAHTAGALFLVHPALAESVAWVSGRKDVLSGLFTFVALYAAARLAARPRALWFVVLALATAAAMYSKATAVVLPLLAALVVWHKGGARSRWLAPLLALLVTVPIAWHHQSIAADQGTLASGSVAARLAQVPGAYAHYVQTAVWPLRLNVLYPEVATLERFAQAGRPIVLGLAALAVVGLAFAWFRRTRLAGIGLLAFFTALLPFNTAFPASSIAAADRYLYLALPGLAWLLAVVAEVLPGRHPRWLAPLLVLPLAWLAGGRAQQFRDDQTLWNASLAVDADNAVAHLNLVYDRMGTKTLVEELRGHLDAAVRSARYPIHELKARQLLVVLAMREADYKGAAAHAQAAVAAATAQLARETSAQRRSEATGLLLQAQLAAFEPLQLAGDEAAAAGVHDAAKQLAPSHPDVVAFTALRDLTACREELLAKAKAGQAPRLAVDDPRALAAEATLSAAQTAFRAEQAALLAAQRITAEPTLHAGLAYAQGEWQRARDQVLAALRHYGEAVVADPNCIPAWLSAARLLREREMWSGCEEKARAGLAVRPDPALRQELALALIGQGRLNEAELQLEAYLRARPEDTETSKVLANVLVVRAYTMLGNPAERAAVRRLVDKALAYNKDELKAHLVLGRLAKEEGRLIDAVRHLERAHKLLPTFEDARQLYVDSLAALGYEKFVQLDEAGALAAWQQCLAVAPPDFDAQGIRDRILGIWQKYEAEGVRQIQAGQPAAAAVAFRKCLQIDPEQHWAAWLLAMALQNDPAADLAEVETLCRQAVAWQRRHQRDKSQQVLLLACTLEKRKEAAAAKAVAAEYLQAPDADAKPQILAALRSIAGD